MGVERAPDVICLAFLPFLFQVTLNTLRSVDAWARRGGSWGAVEGAWLPCPECPQGQREAGAAWAPPDQSTGPTPQGHGVSRVMAPKDVHVLVPGLCKHAPLHGKRDTADVIKNLEMRGRWVVGVA